MQDETYHRLFRPDSIKVSSKRRRNTRTSKIVRQTFRHSLAYKLKRKEKEREKSDEEEALINQDQSHRPIHLSDMFPRPLDLDKTDASMIELKKIFDTLIFTKLRSDRRHVGLIYRPKLDCFCLMINEHMYWVIRLSSITMGSRHPDFLLSWLAETHSRLCFFVHAPSNKWGGLVFRNSDFEDGREMLIFSTLFPCPNAGLMRIFCGIECSSVDGRTQLQLSYTKGCPDGPLTGLEGIKDITRKTESANEATRPTDRVGTSSAHDLFSSDSWIIIESRTKHKVYRPNQAPPS